MKRIGRRRHARALGKEMRFWRRPGIVRAQAFRVSRYRPFLVNAARLAKLEPDGRVLDIGCGPTCCTTALRAGRKWYLDPLLDEYRKICDLPEGEHLAASIEDVELPLHFFDLVVCLNVLDHVRDPWRALEVIWRALKPGGVFLCAIYTRRPWIAFLRNLQEYLGVSTDVAHPYSFTVAAVSAELRRVGFAFAPPQAIDADRNRSEMIWCCAKPPSGADAQVS